MPRRRLALLLAVVGVVASGSACGPRDGGHLPEPRHGARVLLTDEAGPPVPCALLRVHRVAGIERESFDIEVVDDAGSGRER